MSFIKRLLDRVFPHRVMVREIVAEIKRPPITVNFPATRFYGDGTTIHSTSHIDIEIHHGKVVSCWFRCQHLPFHVEEVGDARATAMKEALASHKGIKIHGVTVEDL